jgi:hypothetical protein
MRPRANDRHFAQQYIHQLGELVDIRAPHNAANARHARIVLDRLLEVAAIFERRHRSELEDLDDFIIVPMPRLAEEYGTALEVPMRAFVRAACAAALVLLLSVPAIADWFISTRPPDASGRGKLMRTFHLMSCSAMAQA